MKEYEKILKEKELYGMVPMKMSCRSRAVKDLPHMEEVMKGKFQQLCLFNFFVFHWDVSYCFVFLAFSVESMFLVFGFGSQFFLFFSLSTCVFPYSLLLEKHKSTSSFYGSFVPKKARTKS
jgi:hypothetical protein